MSVPFEGTMPWYGRTLGAWSELFQQSGWRIGEISEPTQLDGTPVSLIFILEKA